MEIRETAVLMAKMEFLLDEINQKQALLEATKALPDRDEQEPISMPDPITNQNWVVRNIERKREQLKTQ